MAINKIDEVVIASSLKQIIDNKAEKTYVDNQITNIITQLQTGDSNTLISAKGYTDTQIAALVNSSPSTLDTLNELATALGDDPNFATTISTQIGKKADKILVPVNNNILIMDTNGNLKDSGIGSANVGQLNKTSVWTMQQNFNNGAVVQLINNAHPSSDLINTYPVGYSIFLLTATNGFPISTGFGFVTTFNFNDTCGYQEVVEMYTGTDNTVKQRRWFRTKRDTNSFWQPFQEVWTDGYMGSGSGLDADKLDGKDSLYYLDYNNFSNVPDVYTKTEINTQMNGKVDKISGKGLSTNDFSNTYKSKVDGIASEATKVEDSTTNGNIKINGAENVVYTHPTSGATAGTYKSVTVDANGHVTGGNNPTTLSDYGITDAVNKIINLANSIDFNTVIVSGFYRIHEGIIANAPNGANVTDGQLIVSRGGDTIFQIITGYSNNEYYMRQGNRIGVAPVWQPWRRLWHDGNFDPTLKADKTYVDNKLTDGTSDLNAKSYQAGNFKIDYNSDSDSLDFSYVGVV